MHGIPLELLPLSTKIISAHRGYSREHSETYEADDEKKTGSGATDLG